MNIAFFGTHSHFSASVFRQLTKALPIKVMVVPNATPFAPPSVPQQLQLQTTNYNVPIIESLAHQFNTNIIHQAGLSKQQLAEDLVSYDIDIIIVACYPHLIPDTQLKLSRFGALNIHPSLLPKYRGPNPVFWQLRHNEPNNGVSLHCLSQDFDAGNIVKQRVAIISEDIDGYEIDKQLASIGAAIVTEVCESANSLQRFISNSRQQDNSLASYQHAPQRPLDFTLNLKWSAQHAYRFMCGTQHWQTSYPVNTNAKRLILTKPISYSDNLNKEAITYQDGNIVLVNFLEGSLRSYYEVV